MKTLIALAAFGCALAPAWAASTASSAASDSGSASSRASSGSLETSSDSSRGRDRRAAGDYRVVAVAAAPARPGMARMTLRAVDDAAEMHLYLPQQAAADSRVAAGQVVSARERPYGLEFARADTGRAFFLLLADDWLRELNTTAVEL